MKLVIEVDGSSHDSPNDLLFDEERSRILENSGIKILRFRNEEIQSVIRDMKGYIESLIDERYRELYENNQL